MKKIILFTIGLLVLNSVSAQQYIIDTISVSKGYETKADYAFVDFISTNKLNIRENSGTKINELGTIDGQNHYRAECYVPDGDKQTFAISSEGGTETRFTIYLEPKDYNKYEVKVSKIESIKWEEERRIVVPKENTAAAYISCKSNQLIINTETGTLSPNPELKNGWYTYEVFFDLSTPEKKETEHVVNLSVGGAVFVPYLIGKLEPKQGKAIIVLIVESCYEQNINHANESFRKGMYSEAHSAYQKAFECSDKPTDIVNDEKRMKNMLVLRNATKVAQDKYAEAESFRQQQRWEESLTLYQEAYRLRLGILKMNPSDEYCLQHQKIYEDLKKNLPRKITGKVVNNVRMDSQGNNVPISGIFIIGKVYRKLKSDGSFDEEDESKALLLGETNANGEFQVYLPKNQTGIYHSIVFNEDKHFKGKKNQFEYRPTSADIQEGLIVKITPKNINRQ